MVDCAYNYSMKKRAQKKKAEQDYQLLAKWTAAVVLVAFGLIMGLAAFGLAGIAGSALFTFGYGILGVGAFLLPFLLMAVGVAIMLERTFITPLTGAGIVLILLSTLTFLGIISSDWGGVAGTLAGHAASEFFGLAGAIILLIAISAIGLIIATDVVAVLKSVVDATQKAKELVGSVKLPGIAKNETSEEAVEETPEEEVAEETPHKSVEREPTVTMFNDASTNVAAAAIPNIDAEYEAPPLSLLGEDKGKPGVGDIKANANIIKRTFMNFGISVEMDEVSVGPTVTRYAIKPAEGVRLQKIVTLQQTWSLLLPHTQCASKHLFLASRSWVLRCQTPLRLRWVWAASLERPSGTHPRSLFLQL